MLRDCFGEHAGNPRPVRRHPVIILGSQRHNVVVGCELAPACEVPDVVLTLSLQFQRHFLPEDVATEYSCEGTTHEVFEAPIEALYASHREHLLPCVPSRAIVSGFGGVTRAPGKPVRPCLL